MTFPLVMGVTCTLQASQAVTSTTVAGGSTTPGGPITFLTGAPHLLVSGDIVWAQITGSANVMAGQGASDLWEVAVADATHFSLVGSQGIQTGSGGSGHYVHVGHIFTPVEMDPSSGLPVLPSSPFTLKVLVTNLTDPVRVCVLDSLLGDPLPSWPLAAFNFASGIAPAAPVEVSRGWDELSDCRVPTQQTGEGNVEYWGVAVLFRVATFGGSVPAPGATITLSAWLD